ncbi:MAG: glycosyltransferase family 4 protein [Methylococcaceae bacterium]
MDCTIALVGPIETTSFLDILHLPDNQPYPKGIGGSPVNLMALELHKRGYNLLLCSEDPTIDKEITLQGERLKIRFVPCRKRPARSFFAQESKWMTQVLIEEQPDIVHAHWTYEFALAAEASGLPYLITAHDAPLNILKLNFIPYRMARTLMAYVAVWKAKNLSAVSPYVAKHLKKYLFYRKPITIIPNGMPDKVFNRSRSLRQEDTPLTFATILVGWSGYKNGEAAIKAFSILYQKNQDCRLIMFGGGHGIGEEAEQWAKNLDIHHGIEFVGQIAYEELIARLSNDVDILVHPALEEAQPMSLIEAMAMGIPVIAGKYSGGVPWTLDNGKAGILVDVSNPEEIANAMLDLATDTDKRKQIGLAGLEQAKKNFHISVVTDAYLNAYQKILSGTA